MNDENEIQDEEMAELREMAREACDGRCDIDTGCADCPDGPGEEAPWGAQPVDRDCPDCEPEPCDAPRTMLGAEQVMLKMHSEEGEPIEVNLLQVVNQMFMDMGHIHHRLLGIEKALDLLPEEEEESLILMPNNDDLEV